MNIEQPEGGSATYRSLESYLSDSPNTGCRECTRTTPCAAHLQLVIPQLNLRNILVTVGLDVRALAQDLKVCATCFDEFENPPVEIRQTFYCCEGCATTGDCTCSNESQPPPNEQIIEASSRQFEDAPVIPISPTEPEPDDTASPVNGFPANFNSLWSESSEPPKSPGVLHENRLWAGDASADDTDAEPGHLPRTNQRW